MKKLSTLLIIAFALVLGLTQCKKKVDTIATPSDLGKTVHITVNVGDGDRHIVYPGTGAVVYTDGDIIYVGDGKKYLGSLEYESGKFSGTINEPAVGDYLYFYFLGGLTPSATLVAGTTTDFTVSIANQSSKLPVLSLGRSSSPYTTSTATYGCTLLNKCGLVKFVPATATPETVKVGCMKTTAKIDFATPGITPTATTGKVTLYSESDAAKWAILLVQDEVSTPTVTIAGYNSTIVSVPAVTENMYYTNGGNGVSIAMTKVYPYIDAVFTVGSTTIGSGTTVKFSKGNLQYLGTGTYGTETPKWRFADNQWDYMGNGTNGNVAIDGYSAYNTGSNSATPTDADKAAARDLFGWGTSGGGTPTTPPYMTIDNNGSIYGGTSDIAGTNCDWGVYNKEVIENNDGKDWRTLTSTEWSNLFDRTKTIAGNSQKLYGFATVMGVRGIVVLPDKWDGSVDGNFKYAGTDYTANQYTATATSTVTWGDMEDAGAVFLPAAGLRNGDDVRYVGSEGRYWSSTCNDSDRAYYVNFISGGFDPSRFHYRYYGYPVRLVFEENRICPCQ